MRIEGRKSYPVGPIAPAGPAVPGQAAPSVNGTAAPAEVDRIEISESSREVAEFKAVLGSMSEIRTERVEGIRLSVEDGSYHVESEKLARKVVDHHLEEALRRSS